MSRRRRVSKGTSEVAAATSFRRGESFVVGWANSGIGALAIPKEMQGGPSHLRTPLMLFPTRQNQSGASRVFLRRLQNSMQQAFDLSYSLPWDVRIPGKSRMPISESSQPGRRRRRLWRLRRLPPAPRRRRSFGRQFPVHAGLVPPAVTPRETASRAPKWKEQTLKAPCSPLSEIVGNKMRATRKNHGQTNLLTENEKRKKKEKKDSCPKSNQGEEPVRSHRVLRAR
ncbi:hypothetical protein TGVAND_287990 [Toxoplasma gondii VAND]|uniref:Uncharacterized protein n=1 Tax=Toxoplasma gondii VAND TaxID=933077 RepID=A0A086Q801_TOXGO|nr:hypothetical protein TGVAND_287990 [Toxoplasma gondii VAND]